MRLDHAEDLARFVEELKNETDRGLPLVGSALIDEKLSETLQAFFVNGRSFDKLLTDGNAPLGTFSSRAEACYLIDLIDEFEYREVGLIRKVRSEFAHAKHGTSFKTQKIRGLCSSLKSDLPEGEDYPLNDPRYRFMNAVVCVVLRLYYRPAWVEKERRKPKEWVTADANRWRSFKDEQPAKNQPIIVMGKSSQDVQKS